MYEIKFRCDALVDQNRYIGNDPVGYKCFNDAEFETLGGILLCSDCVKLWVSGGKSRLTFDSISWGKVWQEQVIYDIIAREGNK